MALRTILYGYEIIKGKTVLKQEESEIVKKVFSLYIEGQTLNNIAAYLTDRKIVYYQDEVKWNKNTINRIIENERYVGNEIYPQIISEKVFNEAKSIKNKKSCKQEKHSPEVELLRTICVCGECGSRYKRINTWGTREKWLCSAGCSCSAYIDDAVLENAITVAFNSVIKNTDRFNVITNSHYQPTNEVLKNENELLRLMEQPKLDFKLVAKSILEGTKSRYNCCYYDRGEITEELKSEFSELPALETVDYKLMKQYIKQIRVNPNGEIITVFINNAKISANGGTENASLFRKKSDED